MAEEKAPHEEFDVVVVGSGAGGLSAAVTAAAEGLTVVVLEKEAVFGGTTAFSGGYSWVPGHPKGTLSGASERVAAAEYLRHEAGARFDPARVDAFLENGPKMVSFFEAVTEVRFLDAPAFPDYHPNVPGARAGGRSILAAPLDGRRLGREIRRLRRPLATITFVGMMFNSSQEVNHFFNVTRSLRSALYVARRLVSHSWDLLRYRRGMRLTGGNALVARLALSAFERGVEIRTEAPVRSLIVAAGRVTGVVVEGRGGRRTVRARRGVVLACGGFPHDAERQKVLFPPLSPGNEHSSPAPPGNTGDGLRLGESVGGGVEDRLPNPAAWIPVSLVPRRGRPPAVFPHLVDRYKPGLIAVGPDGRRFVNEANSYHDFGQALIARYGPDCHAYLIADHRALRRYGLGFVKPFPLPIGSHLRSGYLMRGRTPQALAARIGVDPEAFAQTLAGFNRHAADGEDPAFGKGSTAYNVFLGDRGHKPNPCLAPLDKPPFYAVRVVLGDLGTFAGLRTDAEARVLGEDGDPIAGLYATGNDAASIMGGGYPGGGITLGPALTFGFVAGQSLARTKATEPLS